MNFMYLQERYNYLKKELIKAYQNCIKVDKEIKNILNLEKLKKLKTKKTYYL